MKGSITISDAIGIVGVLFLVFLIVTQVLQNTISAILENFSKFSAKSVARQLSNLITLSGSATYKTEITYSLKEAKNSYSVSINSRTIKVVPKSNVVYGGKLSGIQYFAVDLHDGDYIDVNYFLIKKELSSGESKYAFEASKK